MPLPPVFPFQPDPSVNPRYTAAEWMTDIMSGSKDSEVRQALRNVPLRKFSYMAHPGSAAMMADFREFLITPDQPLRYHVPIWVQKGIITSIVGDTITGDFEGIDFVEGGYALLYRIDGQRERVQLVSVADDLLVLEEEIDAELYPVAASRIVPLIVMWLKPPTSTAETQETDKIDLQFTEEFQGIAGIDETLTEFEEMEAYSIDLQWLEPIQPYRPIDGIAIATVKDRSGVRIPNAPIVWTAVDAALAPTWCVPSIDRQSCYMDVPTFGCFLTATVGVATRTIQIIAGP